MSSKRVLSQYKLFSTASYINNVIEEERPGEKKEVQAGNICKKGTYKSQKTQLCEQKDISKKGIKLKLNFVSITLIEALIY